MVFVKHTIIVSWHYKQITFFFPKMNKTKKKKIYFLVFQKIHCGHHFLLNNHSIPTVPFHTVSPQTHFRGIVFSFRRELCLRSAVNRNIRELKLKECARPEQTWPRTDTAVQCLSRATPPERWQTGACGGESAVPLGDLQLDSHLWHSV